MGIKRGVPSHSKVTDKDNKMGNPKAYNPKDLYASSTRGKGYPVVDAKPTPEMDAGDFHNGNEAGDDFHVDGEHTGQHEDCDACAMYGKTQKSQVAYSEEIPGYAGARALVGKALRGC